MGERDNSDSQVDKLLTSQAVTQEVANDALKKFLQDSMPTTYNSTISQTAKGLNVDTASSRGAGSHMEIHEKKDDPSFGLGFISASGTSSFDVFKETLGANGKPVRTSEHFEATLGRNLFESGWYGRDRRLDFKVTDRDGNSLLTMSRANQIDWTNANGRKEKDANGNDKLTIESTSGSNCMALKPHVYGNKDLTCAFRVDGLKDGRGRPLDLNMSTEIAPYPNGQGFRNRSVVRNTKSGDVQAIVESNVTTDRDGTPTRIQTTVRPPRKPQ